MQSKIAVVLPLEYFDTLKEELPELLLMEDVVVKFVTKEEFDLTFETKDEQLVTIPRRG